MFLFVNIIIIVVFQFEFYFLCNFWQLFGYKIWIWRFVLQSIMNIHICKLLFANGELKFRI